MATRSTVYMVFAPTNLWAPTNQTTMVPVSGEPVINNLVTHQYASYALVSFGAAGDQPGRHYWRYLTEWKVLPPGVIFAPFEFNYSPFPIATNIYTTNTLTSTVFNNQIWPWGIIANVPFPTVAPNVTNIYFTMPGIGFTPQGSLTLPQGSSGATWLNQFIVLARASVVYASDTNGNPFLQQASCVETPPGNDLSNPNVIQVDWVTGRATLLQNKFQ
jgi:hypothetical protein